MIFDKVKKKLLLKYKKGLQEAIESGDKESEQLNRDNLKNLEKMEKKDIPEIDKSLPNPNEKQLEYPDNVAKRIKKKGIIKNIRSKKNENIEA